MIDNVTRVIKSSSVKTLNDLYIKTLDFNMRIVELPFFLALKIIL